MLRGTKVDKLSKFLGLDLQRYTVARGAISAAIARIATAVTAFFFNLVLAQSLGAAQTGAFFLALAITTIAGVLSRLGVENIVLRLASVSAESKDWATIKAVYIKSHIVITGASLVVIAILQITAGWMAESLFAKPAIEYPLRLLAIGVLPLSLLNIHAQFFRSIKQIGTGLFLQNAGVSFVALIGLVFLSIGETLDRFSTYYLIAIFLTYSIAVFIWAKMSSMYSVRGNSSTMQLSSLGNATALYVGTIVNQIILPWSPLILLGVWSTDQDVGQFGIIRRLVMLISFAYFAVEAAMGPSLAVLFGRNDLQAVKRTSKQATLLMTGVALPVGLIFILAPTWTLSWFGEDFRSGSSALAIMAIGQLVNALTGSVATLLIMSGNEKYYRNASVVAGIVCLAFCFMLIPVWGLVGAALASAASVITVNSIALYLVSKRLGFLPLPISFGK